MSVSSRLSCLSNKTFVLRLALLIVVHQERNLWRQVQTTAWCSARCQRQSGGKETKNPNNHCLASVKSHHRMIFKMVLQYFVNDRDWCVCALVIDLLWHFCVLVTKSFVNIVWFCSVQHFRYHNHKKMQLNFTFVCYFHICLLTSFFFL